MAARKQKQRRMSAQVVEDEDYQLRYEVAAVDVAKGSAVVCTRVPRRRGGSPAAAPARGAGDGPGDHRAGCLPAGPEVQVVTLESTSDYWRIWFVILEAAGLAVQLVNARHGQERAGPGQDRPVDRTSGPVFRVVRAEAGDAG